MELDEIKSIWSAYDKKLEQSWKLNLSLLRRTNLDKVKSKLRNLVFLHAFTLAFSILQIILLMYFVAVHADELHFLAAGTTLLVWSFMIAYSAADQLSKINEMDYSAPVMEIQKKLISIKLSIIKYLRLSILIIPLYIAHILFWFELLFDVDMYLVANQQWWVGQIIFTLVVMVPLTIWLYKKLSPKNVNKSWMKKLISGSGGKQIGEAFTLLDEIQRFEKNDYSQ
ncbi:hypothetical protein WJR50_26490 [Catalinimonas sp. 4WD22]|uniref:hypothetical protein n=1 Tax=Catalinimonas locisalis TaxID=3133978 RepID=UPI003101A3AA